MRALTVCYYIFIFINLQRSLVATVQQRQMPNMNMLFLNLKVRRSHLVSDSLHEVRLTGYQNAGTKVETLDRDDHTLYFICIYIASVGFSISCFNVVWLGL